VPRTCRIAAPGLVGTLFLGAVGCSSGLLTPTFPQLQEVGEVGAYGTERLRASDACRKAATSTDAYLKCMQDKGWEFIARESVYPAPECWSLRTAGDPGQLPTAQCFHRSGVAPVAKEPAAGP
jgi:hypothetical protein